MKEIWGKIGSIDRGAREIEEAVERAPPPLFSVPKRDRSLMAVQNPENWSACFRGCCKSDRLPLAVPQDEFSSNLMKIHDGPASTVFLGRFNDAPIAVKKPKLPTKAEIDRYHVELRLMASLSHPNIVTLCGARAFPPNYYLLFPYQENGSVSALIHEQGWRPTWQAVLRLLRETACAMTYIHSKGYVHRDIKPSNILIGADWVARLADFGLAEEETVLRESLQAAIYSTEDAEGKQVKGRYISGGAVAPSGGFQKQHMVGTMQYMAPEVLMRQVPGYAADAYAFGVTACEIATGVLPYSDRARNVALAHTVLDMSYNEADLIKAIASEHLRPVLPAVHDDGDASTRNVNADVVEGLSRLIESCWDPNPVARLDFAAVENHLDAIIIEYRSAHKLAPDQPLEPVWRPPSSERHANNAAAQAAAADLAQHEWPESRFPSKFPPMMATTTTAASTEASSRILNAGVFSTCGARGVDKMEDRHVVINNLCGIEGAHLVAVFDGEEGVDFYACHLILSHGT